MECVCQTNTFVNYFIRIGNFIALVCFLIYFLEHKFLVWLRKDDDWVVIDRQMLDTLFDNRDPTKEEIEVSEEAVEEAKEAVEESVEEGVEEAVEKEAVEEKEEAVVEEKEEAVEEVVEEAVVEEAVEKVLEEALEEAASSEEQTKLDMSEVLFGEKLVK